MTAPSYIIFELEMVSDFTLKAISDPGGVCYVAMSGTQNKATLYDPANNYAPLSNPVTALGDKVRFALQQPGGGQPLPPKVDLYGMDAKGHFFTRKGMVPGDPPVLYIDTNERDQTAIIPWAFVDTAANTETNTGFNLPAGSLVEPDAAVVVSSVDSAGHTISFGLLSSESGGNASGFLSSASIATAGTVKGTLNGASPTLGALLSVDSGSGSTLVPEQHVVNATAVSVSYTLAASVASGSGYLVLPYTLLDLP